MGIGLAKGLLHLCDHALNITLNVGQLWISCMFTIYKVHQIIEINSDLIDGLIHRNAIVTVQGLLSKKS